MDDEPLVGSNLDTPDVLAEGGRLCDVLAPAIRSPSEPLVAVTSDSATWRRGQSSVSNRRAKRSGSLRVRRKIWTRELVSTTPPGPSTTSSCSVTFTSRAADSIGVGPLYSPRSARLAKPLTRSFRAGLAGAGSNCARYARTANRAGTASCVRKLQIGAAAMQLLSGVGVRRTCPLQIREGPTGRLHPLRRGRS